VGVAAQPSLRRGELLMRAALLFAALVLGACGPEVCADVDGACVALTVEGVGEIDGLDIQLSGAATGRGVAPRRAEVATLPVQVALALPALAPGPLVIQVVGVRLGEVVGGGQISLEVDKDAHESASVTLGELTLDGGLTTGGDLACPADNHRCGPSCCGVKQQCTAEGCVTCPGGVNACGDVCCKSGEVCTGSGCGLPYQSAQLYVYLCPDFNSGCSASGISADGMCSPINNAQAGKCYATGITVESGQSYSVAACQSCPGSCAPSTPFMTPSSGFASQTFYPGIYLYCQTPCTAPTSCP
jgi:hypothetical protein